MQTPACDVMTFFYMKTFFSIFTCFWAEKSTSANVMTLKAPVLLFHSENMLTLSVVLLQKLLKVRRAKPNKGVQKTNKQTKSISQKLM